MGSITMRKLNDEVEGAAARARARAAVLRLSLWL